MKATKRYTTRWLSFALAFILAGGWLSLKGSAALGDQYTHEELTEVYSVEETKFLQWFSDGYSFKTSISNNQTTPGLVSVEFPPELNWSLEYNGATIEYRTGEYLFQPGTYVFTVMTPNGNYGVFSFTISDPAAVPGVKERAKSVVLTHNWVDGRFVYTFENERSYSANVPNGGIVNYGVTFQADSGLICVLTRNGSALMYEQGDILTEEGYYYMRIISPMVVNAPDLSQFEDNTPDSSSVDLDMLEREIAAYDFSEEGLGSLVMGDIYQTVFSFRIITGPTRDIAVYNVPPGFEFASVICNGERASPTDAYWHRMDKDGEYVITLRDAVSTAPEHVVRLTVKMSPPQVRLTGVVNRYSSAGPVTIHAEEGVTLTVFRNNIEAPPADVFRERGRYQIIASDEAGNTASLSFEIVFALPRRLVLAGLLALLAAGVAYVVYARRSMTV